jgi:hypothetical protein
MSNATQSMNFSLLSTFDRYVQPSLRHKVYLSGDDVYRESQRGRRDVRRDSEREGGREWPSAAAGASGRR